MDMRYAPLPLHPAQYHRFDRLAVDGAIAIGAGDRLNAQNPCRVARFTLASINQCTFYGNAKDGICFQVVAGIFGAAAFDVAGFVDYHIFGEKRERCCHVAIGQRCMECVYRADIRVLGIFEQSWPLICMGAGMLRPELPLSWSHPITARSFWLPIENQTLSLLLPTFLFVLTLAPATSYPILRPQRSPK